MDQVYNIVGFVVVWGFAAFVAVQLAIQVIAYSRGLYWAVSYTLWAAKHSPKKDTITKMMIVKNIFMEWHEMAWAAKGSITATAPNGAHWSN